jgi:hypothetical protein
VLWRTPFGFAPRVAGSVGHAAYPRRLVRRRRRQRCGRALALANTFRHSTGVPANRVVTTGRYAEPKFIEKIVLFKRNLLDSGM